MKDETIRKVKKMSSKFAACFIIILLLITAISSLAGERTIIKKSGSSVTSVMISPSGSSNWIHISTGMAAEGKLLFTFEENALESSYDLKFTDDKGKKYFMDLIDMCSTFETTLDGCRTEETVVRYFYHKDTN